jgi:hypothetical protein
MTCERNPYHGAGFTGLLRDPTLLDAHPLRRMVLGGLQHWKQHESMDDYQPHMREYPEHIHTLYATAIRRQSTIGWDNALRGFLSKAWYDIAEASYDATKTTDKTKGATRMKSLIYSLGR